MYSVLFVDDEPTAKIISQSMADWAKLRLKITAAVNNGAEALAYLESHEADAVITDLQMPVMDGLTLIRELRSRGFRVFEQHIRRSDKTDESTWMRSPICEYSRTCSTARDYRNFVAEFVRDGGLHDGQV